MPGFQEHIGSKPYVGDVWPLVSGACAAKCRSLSESHGVLSQSSSDPCMAPCSYRFWKFPVGKGIPEVPQRDSTIRVLHVGKYLPPFAGGIEQFLVELMRACAEIGIKQAAVGHHHASGVPTCLERLQLSDTALAEVARVRIWGTLLYAPIAPTFGRALESLGKAFTPDLVHVHMPNASAFWLLRSRVLASTPWVVHWHADVGDGSSLSALGQAYRVYRYLERALLSRAARVIATSAAYLATSAPLEPWRSKCRVVPLGLKQPRSDVSTASDSEPRFTAVTALRVLFIGRLSPYKGLEHLIRAVQRTPGVELVVAGTGETHTKLAALVESCGIGARVRLVGYVADDVKNRLMSTADVLCLPSTSRHEAFGLVLVEAMARGTPVIATSVRGSGMSWVVGHSGAGWTVGPGSTAQLANLLAWLRDSPAIRKDAQRAALVNFRKRFQIENVAREIGQVYREVLRK